jgi:hypothetical protein
MAKGKSLLQEILPISAAEEDVIVKNQKEFVRHFGDDFNDTLVDQYWVGPSTDGLRLGLEFRRRDGVTVRASLDIQDLDQFRRELVTAIVSCLARRTLEGAEPAGEA